MKFLLIVMPAILDGGWKVGVPHTILKVGRSKITSVQISDQKILMLLFFLIICIFGITWQKIMSQKK